MAVMRAANNNTGVKTVVSAQKTTGKKKAVFKTALRDIRKDITQLSATFS
jgi:hypothetical protein